jgi:hypothetical protein
MHAMHAKIWKFTSADGLVWMDSNYWPDNTPQTQKIMPKHGQNNSGGQKHHQILAGQMLTRVEIQTGQASRMI